MKAILGIITLLTIGTILAPPAAATDIPIGIAKGKAMVVKVPRAIWKQEQLNASSGEPIFAVEVNSDFLSRRSWQSGELPYMQEFLLDKTEDCGRMRYDCKLKGFRQVELHSPLVWLKIRFAPDVQDIAGAMQQLVAVGTVADFEGSDYQDHNIRIAISQDFRRPARPTTRFNEVAIVSHKCQRRGYAHFKRRI
jgi:hypothetical protein